MGTTREPFSLKCLGASKVIVVDAEGGRGCRPSLWEGNGMRTEQEVHPSMYII